MVRTILLLCCNEDWRKMLTNFFVSFIQALTNETFEVDEITRSVADVRSLI